MTTARIDPGDGTRSMHSMPFGAEVGDEHVRFRVFAPDVESLKLQIQGRPGPLAMRRDGGWFELIVAEARAGSRYSYQLPDGRLLPDPASRFQPEDVHAASEVIDPRAYVWEDEGWKGRPWTEAILYELHVGAFTPEGTFRAATARLDHLAELGITAIELMAIADFAGNRNWGYDGVLLYAPDSAYGRPEDVKGFIDAAHARGIMVILDVVYNHFGPEGNYLPAYFHEISSEKHQTPWGAALNFDAKFCRESRELVIHNALYWIEEFHLDGLRLDASHRMIDDSPHHLLDELRDRVQSAAGARAVHLILEDEYNTAGRLGRDDDGSPASYTAQWNHDITHLLGAAMTEGCTDPRDDAGSETEKLGLALTEGFVIATRMKDAASPRVPPTAYVAFIQTHDLIGNRIFGDRLHASVQGGAAGALAAIYLLLPQIPMMFMGEEWAATTPFPFFSDYHGELAEAVRRGRCEQLKNLDPAPTEGELRRAPNPQAESTFRSAQLQWGELDEPQHAATLARYKRLIQVRRERIVPALAGLAADCGSFRVIGPRALEAEWTLADEAKLKLAANLCERAQGGFSPVQGEVLWLEGTVQSDEEFGAWAVRWTLSGGS